MLKAPWVSATRSQPCPVCGRADWCYFIPGGNAICRRIESTHPQKKGGWLHLMQRPGWNPPPPPIAKPSAPPAPKRHDLHILARRFAGNMFPARLNFLARTLNLSAESLTRLNVGWSAGERMHNKDGQLVPINAWSFPMRDPATDVVVGIRMRSIDHKKFSWRGGAGGLFIPRGIHAGRAYLTEGPTDTAAAMDMGLNVFGRESCDAGVDLIVAMLNKWRFPELVIFSQRDEAKPIDKRRPELGVFYPAQRGAERLAGRARLYCPVVRVIMPPEGTKDVRIWKQQGGTAEDVEREVMRTPAVKLKRISTIDIEGELEGAGTP